MTAGRRVSTVDSNSLPMAPDVVSKQIRCLVLGVLAAGVGLLIVLVLLGMASTPTVTLEATVVDSVPSGADAEDVYPLSRFAAESPVRAAVERSLGSESESRSVETTTERYRAENVPATEFHVRHEGRVVRVSVESG
jgi:hypothetical protein